MAKAFNHGQLAAIIYDKPLLEHLLKQKVIENGVLVQSLGTEQYGIAVGKKHKELEEKLNKALADMKKFGELDALYKKWF